MTFPSIDEPVELASMRRDVAPWRGGLETIAARHGVEGAPRAEASGTQPVFVYPDAVVKVYAPAALWGETTGVADHDVERSTLDALGDAVPAPRLLGEGSLDGWPYLVQSRVKGQPLERVLPDLADDEARAAMRSLGEAVAAVHATAAGDVLPALPSFEAFLAAQARDLVAIESRRGAPEAWLEGLEAFVEAVPRGDSRPVVLHTELGPSHALFEGARLMGIIDWAETLVGDREYDFAAVAFFIARGDGALLGAFLDGYGWRGVRGVELARRLLRYLLLHRYAPLAWLLEERPVAGATTFDDLAAPWMGVAR